MNPHNVDSESLNVEDREICPFCNEMKLLLIQEVTTIQKFVENSAQPPVVIEVPMKTVITLCSQCSDKLAGLAKSARESAQRRIVRPGN